MDTHFSIAEAKNRLPAIIHGVEQGSPITLTRHGNPVAVVMSVQHYKVMVQNKSDFWNAVVRFRNACEGVDEFGDEDFNQLRDTSPGRDIEL